MATAPHRTDAPLSTDELGVPQHGPRRPWWLRALVPAVVVIATFAAFGPVLFNGFVDWDDDVYLTTNYAYRGLDWDRVRWMFTTFHEGHYQPLTWLTYGFDYSVWGLDARGFHLTNLILHAINALLFYALAFRLIALAMPQRVRDAGPLAPIAAGLAALVFAVHPLRVESVAWATERRDVLSGLFWLLTLLAYLRAHAGPSPSRRWLVVSFVLFALALLSKVMVVSLPAVLVVLDVYPLRRLRAGRWLDRQAWPVWLEKLPFFVLAGAFAAVAPLAQAGASSMRTLEQYGVLPRVTQATYGLAFYVRKTVLPFDLSPLYELKPTIHLSAPPYLVSALFVIAVTALLLAVRRRWPAGLAAWVCYGAILFPVSGILQNGPQITADRYSYLSCMGWAVLVGAALIACRPSRPRGRAALSAVVATTGAAGIVALGLLTWHQTHVWRDSLSLWTRVVDVDPDCLIGNNDLGRALAFDGQLDRAVPHFRKCLELKPDYVPAIGNLAMVSDRQGRTEEAAELYRQAVRADPNSAAAHYNLGLFYVNTGRLAEAEACFRRAVELDENSAPAWNNLAGTLLGLDRYEEGIDTLRSALRRAPGDLDLVRNLAWALATCPRADLRDPLEAVRLAERACAQTDYQDARCLQTLAAAYHAAGRPLDAQRAARQAQELRGSR
jgi:tetratricopeptide (TPR) repeat protein